MLSKVIRLQEALRESDQKFATRLGINRLTLAKLKAGHSLSIPLVAIESIERTLNAMRNQPTTEWPELLIPDLRPSLKWVAMHALNHYQYQWSAFEAQPEFEEITGLWTLRKDDPRFQVNITNMLVIPYDAQGPARSLFHRPNQAWERAPTTAPEYKENLSSNQPDDLMKITKPKASFPETTLSGLISRGIENERNRR